jgi:hypothetical protein
MLLPFSKAEFFDAFASYNLAVWPAQWALSALGLAIVGGALSGRGFGARFAYWSLGALWIWMAAAYHIAHFAAINPAARVFAALYIAAGALFIWRGSRSKAPLFRCRRDVRGVVGFGAAAFGLLVYPLLNPLFGHHYPAAPGFGLPCPTTIFTLGVLSWAEPAPERKILAVPILWAFIGSTAAILLGVAQDYVLLATGLWGLALLAPKRLTASGRG